MRVPRAVLLLLPLVLLDGCMKVNPIGDGSAADDGTVDPPDVEGSLGAFDVTATIKATSCGIGALGMANQWTFVVGLGREGTVATWDVGGGPITGTADASGKELSFDARLVIDMRKEADGESSDMPACSIERQDLAKAVLDDAADPSTFTGTLTYAFAPTVGSNCADLFVGPTAQFAELPCTVQYGVSAKQHVD